jgi:hypothetical protein
MRALVKTLGEQPGINATFDDDAGIVTRYGAVHIGIATQTPSGLTVPVVRHAEARSIWDSAAELTRLADAARNGTAAREEMPRVRNGYPLIIAKSNWGMKMCARTDHPPRIYAFLQKSRDGRYLLRR